MKPRQYNSWSPASACLKCPVLTAESPARFSPNPLPGLTDPRSAYYNIPLGAIYLPVTGCVEVGPYIVGRILDESLPAFTGMVHHETAHEYMKTTLYRTAVRVSAARAYRALWQLFEGAGYESWCELQAANRAIASLMKSAGPIDELIATVLGVRQHKTSPTALQGEAARVERQFVTSQ